jgi:hypothetical protein
VEAAKAIYVAGAYSYDAPMLCKQHLQVSNYKQDAQADSNTENRKYYQALQAVSAPLLT